MDAFQAMPCLGSDGFLSAPGWCGYLILKVRSLTRWYPGAVLAPKDVSLEIGEGVYGLLGATCAGKSPLMQSAAHGPR